MEELKKIIHEEFGDSIVNLSITKYGNLVDVSIAYENNRPVRMARAWLDEHIKNLWHLEIERLYSMDVIRTSLMNLYESDDDTMYRVEEYMHEIDFTDCL